MPLNRAVISIASMFWSLSAATAQQVAPAASTVCNTATRGTVNCPVYTAPATTAVPRASMDGSMVIPNGVSTLLFNGAVPPNGFMLQSMGAICFVNDNGTASTQAGFVFGGNGTAYFDVFVTPPGYKPIGPVSVFCAPGGPTYLSARGW